MCTCTTAKIVPIRPIAFANREFPIPDLSIHKLSELLQSHKTQEVAAQGARLAAVALILVPVSRGCEILLMKRVERTRDPWSGQISLPGGHMHPSDSDLIATARRETSEEVGLELTGEVFGQLDDVHPRTPLLPPIVVRPFVFVVPSIPRLSLGAEATLEIRVRLADLAHSRNVRTVAVQGRVLKVSGYAVGPHFVWGLTERVLTSFLELVGFEVTGEVPPV